MLYQLKREDEFDSADNDPVHEYQQFMQRKESLIKSGQAGGTAVSASNVSYMYINSGVPVIVFNYGANPKRRKDMRILLAERATGFCMFEFKFDCITKLLDGGEEKSDMASVIQLKFNDNPVMMGAGGGGGMGQQQGLMYANGLSQQQQFNYHNEYFERFFSSKSRHARKEHLLKFIIKRGKIFKQI